jgi:antitoxin CptB
MPDLRLKKIAYRASHRGFREADLILGGFAERYLDGLTAAQLDEFEALLELPDHDLYDWIVGRAAAPAAVEGEVFGLIRSFRHTLHAYRGEGRGA